LTNSKHVLSTLAIGLLALGLSRADAAAATVDVYPKTVTMRGGMQLRFVSYVIGSINQQVTWSVDGVVGGNERVGFVLPDGTYTAPAVPPVTPVAVTATSVAYPSASAAVIVTVFNPLPVIASVAPTSVAPGPFTITVDGTGFVPTSVVKFGGAALATTFHSPGRLTAAGTARVVAGGLVAVTVSNSEPGAAVSAVTAVTVATSAPRVSTRAAVRFLEQASWGPTPETVHRVQQIGFDAYLEEQFVEATADPPVGSASNLQPLQRQFVIDALTRTDQLRQRVAFALGQILVVSGLKAFTQEMFAPWLQMLNAHAFSDYGTLLRAVSLSPAMGLFLDHANNQRSNSFASVAPNENYARELMQLFSIGPSLLHPDGTIRLDDQGKPMPAYDQAVVLDLARALTGWTYPTKPGAAPQPLNPLYFNGPLEPVPSLHDPGTKVLLDGFTVPGGQTPQQDLESVIGMLMGHPNTAPFVARRLIQQLVTSNPSPQYVARVAAAFASEQSGPRGDLKRVVKAIVLDPEARMGDEADDPNPASGHLREPILFSLALMRALSANPASGAYNPAGLVALTGQHLFYPPSVNNYFPLDYVLPGTGIRAPEFQILTPATAVGRANLALIISFAPQAMSVSTNLASFSELASSPALLVEAVNQALLAGTMSDAMRHIVEQGVAAVPPSVPLVRAQTAIFLVASSSDYQVQR
jgi:uncharacterized protein (DUF1800 family)